MSVVVSVPLNKVLNISQTDLTYELLVFLSRECLCESVSWHLSSGNPLQLKLILLNFLT